MNPLDYSLCCQTVTLYRKTGEMITRKVLPGCYLSRQLAMPQAGYGKSMEKKFLLIIPGNACPLQPGDRVFDGIGPACVDWQVFLPASVPELLEVNFAKPCYWDGELVHWEAGCRKEAL